jgi:4-azaleucine resistance transporter AzlC
MDFNRGCLLSNSLLELAPGGFPAAFLPRVDSMRSPRAEFTAGLKAVSPIIFGDIPVGLIYGVIALEAGLPPSATQAMSAIIFAGSSQFVAAQLFSLSTPAIVIIASVGVINLRHLLYSASVAPYLQHLPARWKWLLAYLLTDEAYAVSIIHYQDAKEYRHKHWFFLASGLLLWTSWQLSTAAGILLGAVVPESWSLDFTVALTFIALVVPALRDRAAFGAAIAAGVVSVAAFGLQFKLGLFLAALTGILVGVWLESRG